VALNTITHNPNLREYMTLHLYIAYTYNVSFTYYDCYFKLNMQDIIYMYIFCIYDTNTLNIISVLFHADLCSDINRYGRYGETTPVYISILERNMQECCYGETTPVYISILERNM
jgi:hypothetical protein